MSGFFGHIDVDVRMFGLGASLCSDGDGEWYIAILIGPVQFCLGYDFGD